MGVEAKLKTLDVEKNLGVVTLSDGTEFSVPRLSMLKIIQIVKFLGVDGAKIYSQAREILIDDSYDLIEKYAIILESIQEAQVMRIFSIILELEDKQSLALDPNDLLEILLVLSDKLDLKKTFTLVRQLMKKMFDIDLPDFKELIDRAFPEAPMELMEENTSETETEEKQEKEEATA
ncbi:hypothetical protein [Priestia megaterium]|uniref:hypothetical protein n=1 Tax=Priestia megaterium TaxID=1404 RepID=UPI000BED2C14|nr:hypothetical protein [Priestia megaterium]MED4064437.1 hypothetical protein [Priestia megaterium]PEA38477.1 hypothetical protein CON45_12785 [Priestia megaterium]